MNIPPGLKLRHIEAFLAVARSGTISAAARVRNVSQPALSKTVNELETILGTALFERTGRRAILTPAGEGFRAHALAALQSLEAGCAIFREKFRSDWSKSGCCPRLRGIFPTVALDYHRTHRDARVGIITGPNRYLLEMLRSGD